jgi:hypothetical protein
MKQIACRRCFHNYFLHFDETGLLDFLLGTFVASQTVLHVLHPRAAYRQIHLQFVGSLHEVLPLCKIFPLSCFSQVESETGHRFLAISDLQHDRRVLVALRGGVKPKIGLNFEELVEPRSPILEGGLRVTGGDDLLLLGLPHCLQCRPTPSPLLAPHLLQLDLERTNVIFHLYTPGPNWINPTEVEITLKNQCFLLQPQGRL